MTEDYKSILLNYITGTLQIENGNNEPQFVEIFEFVENNLFTYFNDNGISYWSDKGYKLIRGKTTNGENIDRYLFVGVDINSNRSFIIILDQRLMPIQCIKSYSSGTNFGIFENFIIDTDGRFYCIENVSGTKRFVMLNNILVKAEMETNYKVVLRQSYNLPASLQSGTFNKLIKQPIGNKYLMCSTTTSGYPLAVELTINVGAANEWVEYTYSSNKCDVIGAWATWDSNDNLDFRIVAYGNLLSPIKILVLNKNGSSIGTQYNFNSPGTNNASYVQATIINPNAMYLSFTDIVDNIYNQYIYSITNSLNLIYKSENTGEFGGYARLDSKLYNDGINAFIGFNYFDGVNYQYYVGIIFENNVYLNNIDTIANPYDKPFFATFSQFNLYSFYAQHSNYYRLGYSIFNNLDYNGLPYSNTNALVPHSSVLYKTRRIGQNKFFVPLFARNLYNKVVRGNTTVSTVEVPNTMINGVNITKESLFGETNFELITNEYSDEDEYIQKNIYETLDINFYNTLLMQDRNNIDNVINNVDASVRINKSVSNTIDYNNLKITKLKINYEDDTNTIKIINTESDLSIVNGIATYTFYVFSPQNKTIKNLQLVSDDEETIYLTITGNFEEGKTYKIEQNLHIE